MTCYLTDDADPRRDRARLRDGRVVAAKLYPAHATTNSARRRHRHRATSTPALEAMQRIGMPLLVHGEVTDPEVDIFDREAVFIERVLARLVRDFPALKIVFEHITTAEAVAFVESAGPNVAATVTPHHLVINRNAMFAGGLRPHAYCLPVAKRERHRLAVRRAATSGSPKFFLGTDSAPHARRAPRKRPAAAPASSTRRSRSKPMRRCSRRKARSTGSRPSRRRTGRVSTACRSTRSTVTLERAANRGAGRAIDEARAVPGGRDAGLETRRLISRPSWSCHSRSCRSLRHNGRRGARSIRMTCASDLRGRSPSASLDGRRSDLLGLSSDDCVHGRSLDSNNPAMPPA